MNKNVIVLMPNGHRQNIKVTPNTTILQVLEEICKKHGFSSDDYDIKHFNRVLEPNSILRFTGLSNNAQLEMIPCKKAHSNSPVTIAIQLENGERLLGEFVPHISLAEVLQHVRLDQDLDRTVLTYMHCEIYGKEALKNTTLKSLGLNNGRAVLRLMYRDRQQICTQVSTSDASGVSHDSTASNKNSESESSLVIGSNQSLDSSKDCKASSQSVEIKEPVIKDINKEDEILMSEKHQTTASTSTDYCFAERQTLVTESEATHTKDIKFLGDRNAMIFNQAAIQALPRDELPDEFYDLTFDDAKVLLRDAKRRREELEEAPLLTNVQRQFNREKQTLTLLNKYHYTIIRIQFPDQFILQGLFRPLETVQTIKDFVKNYLNDPNSDFIIFTTPPKHILNPEAHLVDEDLVPSAIVYYSGSSDLQLDVKERSTDPKDVKMQVSRIRISMMTRESQIINEDAIANASSKSTCDEDSTESLNKNKKIPKWLISSSLK